MKEPTPTVPSHYPGPAGAIAITLWSWFAAAAFIIMLGSPTEIAVLGMGEVFGLGLVAVLATRRIPPPHAERIGLRSFPMALVPMLLFLLPTTLLVSELDNVVGVLFPAPDAEEIRQRVAERVDATSSLELLEIAIVTVGLAPVVEEWLFRGVIQQGLVARLGKAGGVVLTAALFGLGHLQLGHSPMSSLALFLATLPIGIMLGAVRIATGSVFACILLHAGFNAISLAGMTLRESWPISGFNAPGDHTPVTLLVASGIAVAMALPTLIREARSKPIDIAVQEDEAGGGGDDRPFWSDE